MLVEDPETSESSKALFVPGELDEMGKVDLDDLTYLIDKHRVGPDMSVEDTCDNCLQKFRVTIDWSYQNFFSTSSR